jgi:hypothetical protein
MVCHSERGVGARNLLFAIADNSKFLAALGMTIGLEEGSLTSATFT